MLFTFLLVLRLLLFLVLVSQRKSWSTSFKILDNLQFLFWMLSSLFTWTRTELERFSGQVVSVRASPVRRYEFESFYLSYILVGLEFPGCSCYQFLKMKFLQKCFNKMWSLSQPTNCVLNEKNPFQCNWSDACTDWLTYWQYNAIPTT